MSNKKMTSEQKKAMEMKYEIAGELGLLEKVKKVGWKGLSSKESGKIGGIMGKRKREKQKEQKQEHNNWYSVAINIEQCSMFIAHK